MNIGSDFGWLGIMAEQPSMQLWGDVKAKNHLMAIDEDDRSQSSAVSTGHPHHSHHLPPPATLHRHLLLVVHAMRCGWDRDLHVLLAWDWLSWWWDGDATSAVETVVDLHRAPSPPAISCSSVPPSSNIKSTSVTPLCPHSQVHSKSRILPTVPSNYPCVMPPTNIHSRRSILPHKNRVCDKKTRSKRSFLNFWDYLFSILLNNFDKNF